MSDGDPVDVDVIERHWTSPWDIENVDELIVDDEHAVGGLITDDVNVDDEQMVEAERVGDE